MTAGVTVSPETLRGVECYHFKSGRSDKVWAAALTSENRRDLDTGENYLQHHVIRLWGRRGTALSSSRQTWGRFVRDPMAGARAQMRAWADEKKAGGYVDVDWRDEQYGVPQALQALKVRRVEGLPTPSIPDVGFKIDGIVYETRPAQGRRPMVTISTTSDERPGLEMNGVTLNRLPDVYDGRVSVQWTPAAMPSARGAIRTSIVRECHIRALPDVLDELVKVTGPGTAEITFLDARGSPKITYPYQGEPILRTAFEASEAGARGVIRDDAGVRRTRPDLARRVRELVYGARKIEAVAFWRQSYPDLSIAQATEAVEELSEGSPWAGEDAGRVRDGLEGPVLIDGAWKIWTDSATRLRSRTLDGPAAPIPPPTRTLPDILKGGGRDWTPSRVRSWYTGKEEGNPFFAQALATQFEAEVVRRWQSDAITDAQMAELLNALNDPTKVVTREGVVYTRDEWNALGTAVTYLAEQIAAESAPPAPVAPPGPIIYPWEQQTYRRGQRKGEAW